MSRSKPWWLHPTAVQQRSAPSVSPVQPQPIAINLKSAEEKESVQPEKLAVVRKRIVLFVLVIGVGLLLMGDPVPATGTMTVFDRIKEFVGVVGILAVIMVAYKKWHGQRVKW
jgi:hypothetical protein